MNNLSYMFFAVDMPIYNAQIKQFRDALTADHPEWCNMVDNIDHDGCGSFRLWMETEDIKEYEEDMYEWFYDAIWEHGGLTALMELSWNNDDPQYDQHETAKDYADYIKGLTLDAGYVFDNDNYVWLMRWWFDYMFDEKYKVIANDRD